MQCATDKLIKELFDNMYGKMLILHVEHFAAPTSNAHAKLNPKNVGL